MSLPQYFPVAPEIATRIFQHCNSFVDVLALSMSCKHLHAIFLSNSPFIIWEVGETSVFAFNDALVAMRATRIVKAADAAGALPPEMDLPSLSGRARKPTLSELQAVLDLRHYVRWVEYKVLLPSNEGVATGGWDARPFLDKSPELLPVWRENFHRAVYRFFIAGAALYRAFHEPFFIKPKGFRKEFLHEAKHIFSTGVLRQGEMETPILLSAKELEILRTFPAYNFTPHPGWEKCFGHLGDWLVGETRRRLLRERGDGVGPDCNPREVLREMMQILVVFGQLCESVAPLWYEHLVPFWMRHCFFDDSFRCEHCIYRTGKENEESESQNKWHWNFTSPASKRKTRRIPMVFFGCFAVREMELGDVRDFDEKTYTGHVRIDRSPFVPPLTDIKGLTYILHCMSGRPNHANGHMLPHPPVHFFVYLLQKHFGYRFNDGAFQDRFDRMLNPPTYNRFIRRGNIFAKDDDWEGLLISADAHDEEYYREIAWWDDGWFD